MIQSVRYECLTEAKSSVGGMRNNSVDRFLPISEERSLLSDGIDWGSKGDMRGGTVVFSSEKDFKNLLEMGLLDYVGLCDQTGWVVGHNYSGRFRAPDGQDFGEGSLTLDIIGMSDDRLLSIAGEICHTLGLKCVLLKLSDRGVYLITSCFHPL